MGIDVYVIYLGDSNTIQYVPTYNMIENKVAGAVMMVSLCFMRLSMGCMWVVLPVDTPAPV